MAPNPENKYDFIIAGMGCAGLSLAMQLKSSSVQFNKVLLVDRDLKQTNDRTWCFWSKHELNWLNPIVFRKWQQFKFKSQNIDKTIQLGAYSYLMIRGIDFYSYCLTALRTDARFEILTEDIKNIGTENDWAFLETKNNRFIAEQLFNSVFRNTQNNHKHLNYLQHFKGWMIEVAEDTFDPNLPLFMDFDIEQDNDCRFVYSLPISKTKALVEYTGFSKKGLEDNFYDLQLKKYIETKLTQKPYTIVDVEKGTIPMYESLFVNLYGERVINIGTAGGYSKPSTGYTFYFIQQNIQSLVAQLEKRKDKLHAPKRSNKYALYDNIFLDVIDQKKIEARSIFSDLFQKNDVQDLLAFLNEESSLLQDLRIMNSLPKTIFAGSAIKKLLS
jgi:lycopene beta-cyclase